MRRDTRPSVSRAKLLGILLFISQWVITISVRLIMLTPFSPGKNYFPIARAELSPAMRKASSHRENASR